ncbi:alcohol dehydrogenase catalytic domain-containing protein [Paraburkholderia sp. BCC1886]|uniref:alcohol dehydrogenase catalytic domain-containing protein n=1 Tax=Paraburkholderia sp. BCC1886 TaxID=2562670 RepID=UPI001C90F599|nr:alcohol dehydrogenase catalytic domain-containing protein [Paraburkholderia sp. BCC1886]
MESHHCNHSMQGVQLREPGNVQLATLQRPRAQPGEVLLRVLAAGLCQTDVHIRSAADSRTPDGTTLGHEIAGEVVELGAGVTQWRKGDRVVVHPCWSCGVCAACLAGRQNACRRTGSRLSPPPTPGVTRNGGMAEYVCAPASALMSIGELDAEVAATLTDAALTPYHAIRTCAEQLYPGSTTVIIGLGGLGNLAAQILRATSATKIVAIDISNDALDAARPWLDVAMLSTDPDLVERVMALTEGCGADVVLDFVGNDATLKLDAALVCRSGAIRVVGLSGGTYPFVARSSNNPLPRGVSMMCPYGGTYGDLAAVIALAQRGAIRPLVTRFALDDALSAFDALQAGKIRGRAVLIPGGVSAQQAGL